MLSMRQPSRAMHAAITITFQLLVGEGVLPWPVLAVGGGWRAVGASLGAAAGRLLLGRLWLLPWRRRLGRRLPPWRRLLGGLRLRLRGRLGRGCCWRRVLLLGRRLPRLLWRRRWLARLAVGQRRRRCLRLGASHFGRREGRQRPIELLHISRSLGLGRVARQRTSQRVRRRRGGGRQRACRGGGAHCPAHVCLGLVLWPGLGELRFGGRPARALGAEERPGRP